MSESDIELLLKRAYDLSSTVRLTFKQPLLCGDTLVGMLIDPPFAKFVAGIPLLVITFAPQTGQEGAPWLLQCGNIALVEFI